MDVAENTTYTLTVTSAEGYKVQDQVTVRVGGKPFAFGPNPLPVGKALNLVCWYQWPNMHVKIYNGMGNVIWQSNGYMIPWSTDLPGWYVLEIDFHDPNKENLKEKIIVPYPSM